MSLDDHPLLVPPGHRIVARFHLLPIRVAGRYRWCEWVRVVQRREIPDGYSETSRVREWADVGYFDEVMPIKPAWEGLP